MIANFQKVNEKVFTGAQPSVEDFKRLKSDNFDIVINLSPELTPNYLENEESIVKNLGMDYIYHPIDCSALKEEQYNKFESVLNEIVNKKLFIHCGGNVKSSGFYYIYQVKKEGVLKEEALRTIEELKVHDQKWYDYFKRMGC